MLYGGLLSDNDGLLPGCHGPFCSSCVYRPANSPRFSERLTVLLIISRSHGLGNLPLSRVMYLNSLILVVQEDRFAHEPYETKYLESNVQPALLPPASSSDSSQTLLPPARPFCLQPDPSASSQPFCLQPALLPPASPSASSQPFCLQPALLPPFLRCARGSVCMYFKKRSHVVIRQQMAQSLADDTRVSLLDH